MPAPDYVEPTTGWRVWDVIEVEGSVRLCSVGFRTVWIPGRPARAICHRSLENLVWAGLQPHGAPELRCSCGIYAARTGRQAVSYFARSFLWQWSSLHRVVGQVSLWGAVIEAERGWRAASAYPAALFVPSPGRGLRALIGGLPRPKRPVEELAEALGAYGVPVEVVDCVSAAGLARAVEGGREP